VSVLPRYPVYVPSKGRSDVCLTAKCLVEDGVPFRLVVEPAERERYAKLYGESRLLVLPWDNPPGTPDGLIKARNWIKAHSISEGAVRHWQLDDNLIEFRRWYRGMRIPCNAGPALAACEDFVDRYSNVAVAGLNYQMFCISPKSPPFYVNVHVYSCTLVLNEIPYRWRLPYNDDTDLCLQVLAGGWCTVLLNAFMANKLRTMKLKGGNTDALYRGDGRLRMARSLERMWPGVVTTSRRFQRPQHVVKDAWSGFDTPLKLRPGVDLSKLPAVDERGLTLKQYSAPKSPRVRQMLRDFEARERRRAAKGA